MASTTEDGAVQAHFKKYKLTLYLKKEGGRVLEVSFNGTSSWCHEISWICTLIPDEYSPYINVKFLQQLSGLKEKFATHGRLTSIHIDRRMFVFRHETEDKAIEMLGSYTIIEEIILKFLRETGAQVTDIKMKSEVDEAAASIDQETSPRGTTDQDVLFSSKHEDDVDAPHSHPQQRHDDIPHAQEDEEASHPHAQEDEEASHPHAQKDEDAAHLSTGSVTKTGMTGNCRADKSVSAGQINTNAINQDNRTVNNMININPPSGKAVVESSWKAKHENIPQPTDIDNESVKTLMKKRLPDSLVAVWWECMVFCFEHESMEDAMGMIVQHADIKEDILHFLQELNPSIADIVMEVEVRELCESEEQTAETSEARPRGMADPEHKDDEGTSRSHPQQKDETSHLHIKETGDNISSLSHSPQKKKKYEETCLPHPQKTEEDKTSLQQTDEDTSHLQPQEVYVKDKFKYQPIKIEKALSDPSLMPLVKGQDSDRRALSEPSQGQSRRKRYPRLSTALHATPPRADYDLFYASKAGDLEKVKRLLSTPGVNVYCRVGSLTPVMTAAWRGHRKVVELLLSEGADVSLVDEDGYNTLHWACMGGDVETVEFVLNVADINSIGWGSWTPVMEAAWRGHRKVVELLVSEGADVSLVDMFGNNILHRACMGGDVETVEFVLSLNVVDINARDKWGETAADKARLLGHQRMVELLVSRGAQ